MRPAVATIVLILTAQSVCAETPAEFMVKLTLDGRKIEGMPLAWDDQIVHLLGRDGRLWDFAPNQATDFAKTSSRFRPYKPSAFRAALLRDLGGRYEVTGTRHYMVAHARGQHDMWAGRFEELYDSFVHYFSVRGFKIQKPRFLIVGVVCRDRRDFNRYSASQGGPVSSGVLGYYSWISNRNMVYDTAGQANTDDWHQTASVIIHEATHQTAFNTGVHSRYAPPPIWVAEGLATMFEAPGVYDSRHHTRRADRINRARLGNFKQLVPAHRPELPASLVASDKLFRASPGAAYAEAWAMTFYLVETQPRKYTRYLKLTAAHPPFREYTPAQRTDDFTSVFGDDWKMFEARFLRFMADVE